MLVDIAKLAERFNMHSQSPAKLIVGILILLALIKTTSDGLKAKVFIFQHFSFIGWWIFMLS